MKELYSAIALVKDNATRNVLTIMADELVRIRSVHPVTEDTKSLANAINKIIGRL